jgi:hypothetical protein
MNQTTAPATSANDALSTSSSLVGLIRSQFVPGETAPIDEKYGGPGSLLLPSVFVFTSAVYEY